MRQKLGRFCTIEFHRLAGPCRRGVSSFPDKPACWLLAVRDNLLVSQEGQSCSYPALLPATPAHLHLSGIFITGPLHPPELCRALLQVVGFAPVLQLVLLLALLSGRKQVQ